MTGRPRTSTLVLIGLFLGVLALWVLVRPVPAPAGTGQQTVDPTPASVPSTSRPAQSPSPVRSATRSHSPTPSPSGTRSPRPSHSPTPTTSPTYGQTPTTSPTPSPTVSTPVPASS